MTRRLQALRVGNFKAFADTQRIPLKPITLIFGPNSAGKSSFIHSLALAHEAQFGREKRSLARLDVHHTDVGGSAIDLGGFRQYVHRGQLNKRVEWGAELKVAALAQGKDQRLAQLLSPVSSVALNIALGIELDDQDRPKPGADPRVDSIEITADGAELLRMSRRPATARADAHAGHLRLDRLASDHTVFRQVLKAIVEAQTTSEEMRPEDFDGANEAIASLLPELVVRVDQFFPSSVEIPKTDGGDVSPVSMLFPVSRGNRREDIAQAVRFVLPRTLNDLIKGLADALADDLKQLQYLGPLRSFPPRHLAFAEHEDANWYAGGGYAWDVVRRDDAVREAVNGWLSSDKLKTPYRLEVVKHFAQPDLNQWLIDSVTERYVAMHNESKRRDPTYAQPGRGGGTEIDEWLMEAFEIGARRELEPEGSGSISKEALAQVALALSDPSILNVPEQEADFLASTIARLATAAKSGAPLEELVLRDVRKNTIVTHRDVGIGISQVLPVLVLAYGSRCKLLAMEQPEIHLHPALQAELGDVFIEAALGERKNTFILETHSEHLILRLMRRMRETHQGKKTGIPPVTPADVSVLYVEPDGTRSIVREMPLNELGELVKSWPGGFFEEGLREQFGDA
ncbi:AAA family ATPase [Diaphorobacter sp.]|uniref:AAA family ATPase n=1 Tax=Diaphorobacter sp. TaxID=1934310 RepID=UPI002590ABB7|nr:AAA family ATPase [Diaphorobacter sp.]